MSEGAKWRGEVSAEADGEISGFVFDPTDLARRFVVELRADGEPIALMRASLFEASLRDQGLGDGCYGFAFSPPESITNAVLAVTLANTDEVVGGAIDWRRTRPAPAERARDGVRWIGGLRFEAWIETSPSDAKQRIFAEIDGETVATDEPDGWAPVRRDVVLAAANRYSLTLPPRFADGRLRRARFRTSAGRELAASPCAFIAFADPPASVGAPDLRAPQSQPFREFAAWRRAYPSEPAGHDRNGKIAVILLGPGDLETSLRSLSAQRRCDWIAAAISQSGDGIALDAEPALQFLEGEGAAFDHVAFAPAGAAFDESALALLSSALDDAPSAPFAYADLVIEAEDGSLWPLAFPAYDQERLLEQGYAARCFALRRRLAVDILRERAAADVFGLLLAALQGPAKAAPTHIPEFLATLEAACLRVGSQQLADAVQRHLEFFGEDAEAAPSRTPGVLPHVHIVRAKRDSVSLIVQAGGAAERVENCLVAAAKVMRGHDIEALLVGDGESLSRLRTLGPAFRHVRIATPGHLMRAANAAVTSANGDLIVLLDPQVGDLDGEALAELIGRASAGGVGAVGPLCVDEKGIVVSAGRVLGPGLAVADEFENHPADAPSYADLLRVAHEVGALGALGMVTRKTLFRDVDGFDLARFRRRFADVDYGLKLRARGARVVLAPSARFVMRAAPQPPAPPRGAFLADLAEDAELRQLRSRWGEALAADPFYNPNLALDRPYGGLAWPPRRREARPSTITGPRAAPPGF